ncbi:amidase [Mucilaginibacter gotjawali]|uniref:Asp-tRNA(Asn)/Glu-tRNA(Gln) amidotransferase A subunit family amidase n=1 Tax=Mucilaginibacter gotjawali TaxID=1550579 RepID=A0A839SKR4_9SPHI|nr:amidase [Mucilaginibacter gotjawali]MBB3058941.1 Asp-tRNA(Asn)/Glu-tRNA(Gln) amidotransferase A subunit family amidase [Mucilaginibacter gotjawali]
MRKTILTTLSIFMLTGQLMAQNVTRESIKSAEKMLDLNFTDAKRDSMTDILSKNIKTYAFLHSQNFKNDVPLPLAFNVDLPGLVVPKKQLPVYFNIPANVELPKNSNDLAFYSIPQLASLIKNKKISSEKLTRFYLDRLRKYGPVLHCVIELTDTIAIAQAKKADADLAKGIYHGPLHGIPYGIKDLFAVKGTHTTWGTPPYKDQIIDETCFVAQKLQAAGAVLVAKLSLGELAEDDVWFGGLTRNPWDISKGSGGSSAGSSSATAAGLVPFAIGTETYGSIVDPSMRCGVTGLRPTYGSIARTGAMALCWTSDKVGPICRSAEEDAIVFNYIHGTDKKDASAIDFAFNYTGSVDIKKLKIAYVKNYIDTLPENSTEKQTLATLKKMGATVTGINFPDNLHGDETLSLIIGVESAAAFDELTRTNQDDLMVQQGKDRWPNTFRTSRFVPAVEYLNACRYRYQLMAQLDPLLDKYDVIITPPETGDQLAITNLTGNPSVTLPNGMLKNNMPASISFIGKHFGEAKLLAFAKAYQEYTGYNLKHPAMFK